jgi:hypothetical protein
VQVIGPEQEALSSCLLGFTDYDRKEKQHPIMNKIKLEKAICMEEKIDYSPQKYNHLSDCSTRLLWSGTKETMNKKIRSK